MGSAQERRNARRKARGAFMLRDIAHSFGMSTSQFADVVRAATR